MARVIGLGIGTFLVTFFAILAFLSYFVSRFSRRVWCVASLNCPLPARAHAPLA
jgi:hypothetical protein